MLQQTSWLASAVPSLAPVFAQAEAKACKWIVAVFLLPPSEVKSPSQYFPLHRVLGVGDKWTSEVEQDSRTKALILSRKLAEFFSAKNCTEKGHISVWKAVLPKDRAKALRAATGGVIAAEVELTTVYFSVIPAWTEEEFSAILAPVKPKPARKPSSKPSAKKGAKSAAQPAPEAASEAAQEASTEAAPAIADNSAPAE